MPIDPMQMSTARLERALLAEPRVCGEQMELFFAPEGEKPTARILREQAAAVLCADCPVRSLCFEYAARIRPEHGIWAGCTAGEIAVFSDVDEVA
ncbi:WhiB family redox-sensing transcriptional regulator [Spinactinospora alkalitolerans]|uniref:WhiB family redox-sensing transcriptional regulator n=1 Tax=Spinactinospora alkalitolerans TaxID=687207 RepID=A0A852U6Q6_9ACTN|nr:WhiB family transcriptional regulator [Spinactinospora alkalitolerans]NYE49600.1 WhiB family redox-sensing transcriptional regulator [Spinactinospora alkalitolerans]